MRFRTIRTVVNKFMLLTRMQVGSYMLTKIRTNTFGLALGNIADEILTTGDIDIHSDLDQIPEGEQRDI